MNLTLAAREKDGQESYTPLDRHGLRAEIRCSGAYPREAEVRITADAAFSGVIRFALKALGGPDAGAGFFLPGFMYGTNRGDAPLITDSKTPRLRPAEDFPASPWWMVRSDRLSHPCAMTFLKGIITGISASPYYLRTDAGREGWRPGLSGDFDQYAGFGCSLENGEVWYTLGYENAPWLFVDSHHIRPRSPLQGELLSYRQRGNGHGPPALF